MLLSLISAKNNFSNIIGSYVDLFKGNVRVNEMSGIVGIGEVVSKTDSFIEAKRYDDGAIDEILMDASDFLAYIDRMIMKSHNGFMKYGICSRIH